MSITYRKELLCEVIDELCVMLELHYEELTLDKHIVKLDPDWARYSDMEHAGIFHFLSAREDEKLVGYSAFFINQSLHYKSLRVAQNDVMFLHPSKRNGMAGIRLIKESEKMVSDLGANKIMFHCKYSNDLKQILIRLGYKDEEAMLGKII